MSAAIQPFIFDGAQIVRTLIRDGDPWFVAVDVCDALGIANSRDAVLKLDEDEKGVGLADTLGGPQEVAIINESGLYTIILRSREAVIPGTLQHRFRKWVTSEVLPSIRRTGGYFLAEGSESAYLLEKTAQEIAALKERRHAINLEIRRLEKRHVRLESAPARLAALAAGQPWTPRPPRSPIKAPVCSLTTILAEIPAEGIQVSALERAVTAKHSLSRSWFYRLWRQIRDGGLVSYLPSGKVVEAKKGGVDE